MEISLDFAESFIGNSSTAANGRNLVKKGSMQNCFTSGEGDLIFGECSGSGKNPYRCSVDMVNPAAPVARCSCPSRQIPCKHAAALMFHYISEGSFPVGDIPADITEKRAKLEKRAENKERKKTEVKPDAPPSKQKITAAKKRLAVQLEGLEIAERLVSNIVSAGLGSIDANMTKTISKQADELGNYHINGIKESVTELLINLKLDTTFNDGIEQLIYINALVKKARAHLESKLNGDDAQVMSLALDSEIEQQIGYVWKLEELRALGSFESDTELVQLGFYSYDHWARREQVDESYMISLQSGVLYKKRHYRPHKALKHVKSDDTLREVVVAKEMFRYPGGLNPRCRWEENTFRPLTDADCAKIKSFAGENYADTAKAVKAQLKSPLSDDRPIALLKIGSVESNCITDKFGNKQTLTNEGLIDWETMRLFMRINPELLKGTALLVMYHADTVKNTLTAKPITIVRDDGLTRLVY